MTDTPSTRTAPPGRRRWRSCAAVDVLVRAWAPPPPARPTDPDDEDDEDEYDDETNGCGCAGDDEYGEPRGCNCGPGCSCQSCVHYEHAQTRQCQLRAPRDGQPYAWCGQPTRYRIKAFCVHRDGVHRAASDGDPAAAEHGHVQLGDSVQWHAAKSACSTQHARELIEQDREHRATWPADSPLAADNTFYEVEAFQYQPDEVDVPSPLPALLRDLTSGSYWARAAVADTFSGASTRALDSDTEALLRYVARIARHAVDYTEHRDADREPVG